MYIKSWYLLCNMVRMIARLVMNQQSASNCLLDFCWSRSCCFLTMHLVFHIHLEPSTQSSKWIEFKFGWKYFFSSIRSLTLPCHPLLAIFVSFGQVSPLLSLPRVGRNAEMPELCAYLMTLLTVRERERERERKEKVNQTLH